MKEKKETNDETLLSNFDHFLDALSGAKLKKEMKKLGKSKKITLTELQCIYNFAVKLYSTMQLKEAEMVFLAYSVLSPYDHRGPGGLASIYLEKKEYKKALDILNTVKTFPSCHMDEVFLDIALCHYKLSEYMDACMMFIIVKSENLNEFYSARHQYLQQQLNPHFKI